MPPSRRARRALAGASRRRGARRPSAARCAAGTGPHTTSTGAASPTCGRAASRAAAAPRRSNTTRSGWRSAGGVDVARGQRGRRRSAVPLPTATAPIAARQLVHQRAALRRRDPARARRRAAPCGRRGVRGLVGDVRPAERRACGTRRSAGAPRSSIVAVGHLDADPGLAQPREPARRPTFSVGSPAAHDHARTPAAISASAHGGVRPWCEHGSRLTYAVAPAAASPAAASATVSACRSPGPLVPALAEHVPVAHHDAADDRVRGRRPAPPPGQLERAARARRSSASRSSPRGFARGAHAVDELLVGVAGRRRAVDRRARRPAGSRRPVRLRRSVSGDAAVDLDGGPRPAQGSQRARSRSSEAGMNSWPPQPGLTLMQSRWSAARRLRRRLDGRRRVQRHPGAPCRARASAGACSAGAGGPRRAR